MDEILKVILSPSVLTAVCLAILAFIRVNVAEIKIGKLLSGLNKKTKTQGLAIDNQQNDLNHLWTVINELRGDNRRLEIAFINQAESYTKQIETLKQEHREEIASLKTFYEGELARLRAELKTYGRTGTGEIK